MRRARAMGVVAALALVPMTACSDEPSSDAETKWVSDGDGDANSAPLWPLAPGWRSLDADYGGDGSLGYYALLPETHGGRAVIPVASKSRDFYSQTGPQDPALWWYFAVDGEGAVYFAGTPREGVLAQPLLVVPPVVRVGMAWQARVDGRRRLEVEVVAREVRPTPFGERPVWRFALRDVRKWFFAPECATDFSGACEVRGGALAYLELIEGVGPAGRPWPLAYASDAASVQEASLRMPSTFVVPLGAAATTSVTAAAPRLALEPVAGGAPLADDRAQAIVPFLAEAYRWPDRLGDDAIVMLASLTPSYLAPGRVGIDSPFPGDLPGFSIGGRRDCMRFDGDGFHAPDDETLCRAATSVVIRADGARVGGVNGAGDNQGVSSWGRVIFHCSDAYTAGDPEVADACSDVVYRHQALWTAPDGEAMALYAHGRVIGDQRRWTPGFFVGPVRQHPTYPDLWAPEPTLSFGADATVSTTSLRPYEPTPLIGYLPADGGYPTDGVRPIWARYTTTPTEHWATPLGPDRVALASVADELLVASVLDLGDGHTSHDHAVYPAVASAHTATSPAGRRNLLATFGGLVQEVVLGEEGTRLATLGQVDLPDGHFLAAAVPTSDDELLVFTQAGFEGFDAFYDEVLGELNWYIPPAFGETFAWRARLPAPRPEATPPPAVMGLTTHRLGRAAKVCWAPGHGPPSREGWLLDGQPPAAVIVQGQLSSCVLLVPHADHDALSTDWFAPRTTAVAALMVEGTLPDGQRFLAAGGDPHGLGLEDPLRGPSAPLQGGGAVSLAAWLERGLTRSHDIAHRTHGLKAVGPDLEGHGLWATRVVAASEHEPVTEVYLVGPGGVPSLAASFEGDLLDGGDRHREPPIPAYGGLLVNDEVTPDGVVESSVLVTVDGRVEALPRPEPPSEDLVPTTADGSPRPVRRHHVLPLVRFGDGTACGCRHVDYDGYVITQRYCVDAASGETRVAPPEGPERHPVTGVTQCVPGRQGPDWRPLPDGTVLGLDTTPLHVFDPATMAARALDWQADIGLSRSVPAVGAVTHHDAQGTLYLELVGVDPEDRERLVRFDGSGPAVIELGPHEVGVELVEAEVFVFGDGDVSPRDGR